MEHLKEDIAIFVNKGYTREQIAFIFNFKSRFQIKHLLDKKWKIKRYISKFYCKVCEKELKVNQNKFCSRSCSVTANNIIRKENRFCINCGKELRNKGGKFYCSSVCHKTYRYTEYIKRWKEGIEDGISGKTSTSSYLRRYLFEKYNNKCSKCGWNEVNVYSNRIPLEIEHIDGDFTNNKESNLELLCPNCHSLTPTFRALNKKSKRIR